MGEETKIGKVSAYVAIIFTIIGGMIGMYEWGRSNAKEHETVVTETRTDTLFVTIKQPITEVVYKDRVVHIRDTVHKIIEKERYVEVVRYDTVWNPIIPKQYMAHSLSEYSELPGILRADREVPEIIIPYHKTDEREWWQDLLYVAGTAGVTYGLTRIK
jgi:hypothetical protein